MGCALRQKKSADKQKPKKKVGYININTSQQLHEEVLELDTVSVVEIKKNLLSFVQFLTGALATENICEPLNLNQYLDANHNHIPLFVIGSPCDGIANSGFKGGLTTSSSALFEMAIKHINSLSR